MNNEVFKIPCLNLDRIITIKALTERQLKIIVNKLKRIIKSSEPGNVNIIQYVKLVILQVLVKEEQKSVDKLLSKYKPDDPKDWISIKNVLAILYNTITDHYPQLRIEYVCADVNGLLDGEITSDKEFEDFISKKKKVTLSTLEDIRQFEASLKINVIGQDTAIESTCNALKLKAAGFCRRKSDSKAFKSVPLNLMFVGKSGTGKTLLSRLVGEKYSNNFWVINCAEFAHGHEINRLLGSPPGYIGVDKTSQLKDKASKSNKWVILFDEIEKGSDKLYNLLLAWMETGLISDNVGVENDFSESIFIFTTNSGVRDLKNGSLNWKNTNSNLVVKEELEKSIERDFSPEFRNRIDEFIYFNELTKEDAAKIAELRLKEYPVKRTDELVKFIVDNGFSEQYGAREIARTVKNKIAIPLANTILSKKMPKSGNSYDVKINNGKVEVINLA